MILLATAALFAALQNSPQTQQAQQPPKASIEGFVVRAGTNEPIARARVTVVRGANAALSAGQPIVAPTSIPVVTTDAQGRFVVRDLEPGTYQLNAQRNGFARQQYGERAPGRPGTPLNVSAGQAVKDVVFRLVPAGTISGRVSDVSGEPLPGVVVQVVRSTYDVQGRRTFQPAGSARTDDRGEYRLYWITPGRYYVTAGQSRTGLESLIAATGGGNNEFLEPGYVITYYPGTTDPSSASAIDVQPGAELSTVDFSLRQQRLFSVRGRLFDARTGQFPKSASVSASPRTPQSGTVFAGTPNNYNAANGTFELRDIAPGSYWLRATAVDTSGILSAADFARNTAQAPVDVSNADVENVVLAFSQGFSIRGRIDMEDGTALPNPEKTRVFISPIEPIPIPSQPPFVQADGTFTYENVQPGDYRFTVSPMPPNSYIKSVRLGQADVSSSIPISGPPSDGLLVVLGTRPGQLSGTLVDKDQKPQRGIQAVLSPDRQRDRRDLYRVATSDQNGQFTIRTLVPGEYKLFAWEDLEPFAYNDPDFLRKYEDRGTPVKISESANLTVEAKIIPAGQ